MIRVALADDHAVVRQGLSQILSAQSDIRVVAEASNHGETLQMLRTYPCDVLILDVAMPGRSGMDTLKQVKAEHPKLPVLILSMYPEDQYAFRALKAGAGGYLTKMAAVDQVVHAIRTVASGRKYITIELAEVLADGLERGDDVPRPEVLSDREYQTLRMIAQGHRIQEIGEALSLSPKTVSVYRARLCQKLRLGTTAELTRYAMEHGLLDEPR
ncbi:MAG: response regulator transcription factor [Burkholderiales bacterium]|nr:response regulator transcription factor [Burkholderiales bacterium]MCE7875748.1 DNA-binding response regulator [Betaproteobacteria bacterium PRO3]